MGSASRAESGRDAEIIPDGGGSWGTGFSCVLRHRGHDVTLACRDPEQARAIEETGRNPRYLRNVDLSGVPAAPLADAPVAQADVVVVALPSRAFASGSLNRIPRTKRRNRAGPARCAAR